MPSYIYDDATKTLTRVGRPAIVVAHDCSAPQPGPETAPHTEMVVQVTLSAQAHVEDVTAVLDRLQAAIKDATAATGGRISIEFAMPDIVRETTVPR